jgi:hypothetical protein
MIRRYPRSIRWRQALPPLLVLTFLLLALLSAGFNWPRWLLGLLTAGYGGALLLAGALESLRRRDIALLPGLPLSLATMHLGWGAAFLWGLINPQRGS